MKVVHIITGLNTGGAEVMLRELLRYADRERLQSAVISLTDIGPVGRNIQDLGVPVQAMNMKRGVPHPGGVLRLARLLRRMRPDVVQTWLYHADLIGGLATRLAGIRALAWGIHISYLDAPQSKKTTLWAVKAGARLSRHVPRKIVCCAYSAQRLHAQIGYDAAKMIVIPNGFDVKKFKPDPEARRAIRRELQLSDDVPLVGLIGRFDPQKDHHNFVQAALKLHGTWPDARFLLCGDGSVWSNQVLMRWIDEAGLRSCFLLLGRREDTHRLIAALDILSLSSSYGEAFPMVVGEAMSCGVPCVVTDVGDAAFMVGETGRVVPPQQPQALAAAWSELLEMDSPRRRELGNAARERIARQFGIESVAARYEGVYREIIEAT